MPYDVYDSWGRKIGEVKEKRDEDNGLGCGCAFLVLLVLPLLAESFLSIDDIFWPWAQQAHHLTPHSNLNGVITAIAIPTIVLTIHGFLSFVTKSGSVKPLWVVMIVLITIVVASGEFKVSQAMFDDRPLESIYNFQSDYAFLL